MTVTVVVALAVGYVLVPSRRVLAMGVVGIAALIHPWFAVVVAASGTVVHRIGRIRHVRGIRAVSDNDGVLAVELVGLGVTAGLPFRNAAALTADQLDGPVARDITRALRSVSAGQLPSIDQDDVQSMFTSAAASETTGMPLAGMLNAVAADRRRAAAAASRERLAKLPVKMLFPLAFLILPGFVLLTVVPPLMSGLSRLGV
jgi:hypothetical protein